MIVARQFTGGWRKREKSPLSRPRALAASPRDHRPQGDAAKAREGQADDLGQLIPASELASYIHRVPPGLNGVVMQPRHSKILDLLRAQGEVTVQALAGTLGVSAMTIRRDLEYLEGEGVLTRTHGGAVFTQPAIIEFAFRDRERAQEAEKHVIARRMAAQVRPGTTLVLDTGTTTLEVARALAGIPALRVLTSSLAIASVLYARDGVELVLLGGHVRHTSPDLTGPLTEENLRQFRTELAILGADALDPDGVYTSDLGIARISRAMLEGARESWLVVDSSKFRRRSFVRFADWRAITHVITDTGLTAADREWLTASVPDVQVVETRPAL
jgi:DeoR family transcriptional regulator of aga operon